MSAFNPKKPYTVRKKIDAGISQYEYEKSCCEQLPEVLVGKEASEYLKQCDEAGVKIINLNELDLDAVSVLKTIISHFRARMQLQMSSGERCIKVQQNISRIRKIRIGF